MTIHSMSVGKPLFGAASGNPRRADRSALPAQTAQAAVGVRNKAFFGSSLPAAAGFWSKISVPLRRTWHWLCDWVTPTSKAAIESAMTQRNDRLKSELAQMSQQQVKLLGQMIRKKQGETVDPVSLQQTVQAYHGNISQIDDSFEALGYLSARRSRLHQEPGSFMGNEMDFLRAFYAQKPAPDLLDRIERKLPSSPQALSSLENLLPSTKQVEVQTLRDSDELFELLHTLHEDYFYQPPLKTLQPPKPS